MTTTTESPGFAHRVETTVHDLAHRPRTSPQQYRQLFPSRNRNNLLRDGVDAGMAERRDASVSAITDIDDRGKSESPQGDEADDGE